MTSGEDHDLNAILAAGGGDRPAVRLADRRHRRILAGGFAVIMVILVVLVALLWSPLKRFILDDGGKAQGERVLAAITLPPGWQDSPVQFRRDRLFKPERKEWFKNLGANSGDLATNLQSLQAAMRESGWGEAVCITTAGLSDQKDCEWRKGDYVITAFFTNPASQHGFDDQPPCYGKWTACALIEFSLYPAVQVPGYLIPCWSPDAGGSSASAAPAYCEQPTRR